MVHVVYAPAIVDNWPLVTLGNQLICVLHGSRLEASFFSRIALTTVRVTCARSFCRLLECNKSCLPTQRLQEKQIGIVEQKNQACCTNHFHFMPPPQLSLSLFLYLSLYLALSLIGCAMIFAWRRICVVHCFDSVSPARIERKQWTTHIPQQALGSEISEA